MAPAEMDGWANLTGDFKSYIHPVENYIRTGRYFIADEHHTEVIGRMPYYGLIYYAFRQVLDVHAAYQAVVVFQVVLESFALLVLCMLAGLLFKRRAAVYATLLLGLVSLHMTSYANLLITESVSFSLLIFFVYHYIRYLEERSGRRLIAVSVLLALLVSLKPYYGLWYLVLGVEQWVAHRGLPVVPLARVLAIRALTLALPLAVWLSPWTVRNYLLLDKFVPFYDVYGGIQYDEADMAYRRFVNSWGGSFVFWDKRSAGCFFEPAPGNPCEYEFPSYVLTPTVTMEALNDVRADFILHHADRSDEAVRRRVFDKFNVLTEAYRKERPWVYYAGSHLIRIKNFVIHSGSYFLPVSSASPCYRTWQLAPKALTSLLYYACLLPGFWGLVILARRRRHAWPLLAVPLSLILTFPVIVKATEWRYFTAAYPFLLIGLVAVLLLMKDAFSRRFGSRWKA